MDAATSAKLAAGAVALGVPLAAAHLDAFDRYLALLSRWNSQINLTRVIDPTEIIAKHFLDSLAIVPHINEARTLIDVGSGGGFPGAVAALVRADLRVTLVESVQKKAAFLEALRRELALPVVVEVARLERLEGRTFDVAVSRATFAPPEWVKQGARLVAPGGILLVMLGRERPPLPTPTGFDAPQLRPYRLPIDGERALALFRRST